jgi:beta-lactamase regulating signal transducer with metallopeptidase domain
MAALWLLRVFVGGGLLLLATALLLRCCRQPARQQRLGEGGMAAALLLALLGLAPAWLVVAVPCPVEDTAPLPERAAAGPGPAAIDEPAALPGSPGALPDERAEGDEFAGIVALPDSAAAARPGATAPAESSPPAPQEDEAASPWRSIFVWLTGHLRAEGRPALIPLLALWALGAVVLLGRWLLGYVGLWRLLRDSEPAPERLGRMLARMATGPAPRLRVSRRVRAPLSCGLFHPTIVLPAPLCRTADPATLRWVFAHELTHLERRDAWTALLFALGQAVYYPLPWFWWLRRQVRLCQEYVADAGAVAQHRQPEDYAQFLLSLIQAPALPSGATGVSGHSDLFRRVCMLLQSPIPVERRCPPRFALAAAAGLVLLAVLLSGIGLRAEERPAIQEASAAPPETSAPAVAPLPAPPPSEPSAEQLVRPIPPHRMTELPDFDSLFRRWPANFDPRQLEQFRRDWQRAQEEWRKALEQAQNLRRAAAAGRLLRDEERRLGVRVERPDAILADQLSLPPDQGLVVELVQPDSPAARAGIKINDVLLELNARPVSSDPRELARMLDELRTGVPVDVLVLRKGQKHTLRGLTLPETRPGRRPAPRLPLPVPATGHATSTLRQGDRFTTRLRESGLIITVSGAVSGRKVQVTEIRIEENGTVAVYTSLEEAAEEYHDRIRRLIEQSGRGSLAVRSMN